jgi:hypothetical protein
MEWRICTEYLQITIIYQVLLSHTYIDKML